MRAWLFQDNRQKEKLGVKCPWSVGWYTPEGKKRSKRVGAKLMAEKYRRKIEADLATGLYQDRKRTKWADFRSQFEELIKSTKEASTLLQYQLSLNVFENFVKPVYVDAIDSSMIDRFVAQRAKDIASATVNKDLRHIRAALRKASAWGMLQQTPIIAFMREYDRDPEFVDDSAFADLYQACKSMTKPEGQHYPAADWWQTLITFAYLTGWRIGEILALRREHLDMREGIAFIPAEETKGKRDARVELNSVVVNHLKGIIGFGPLVFEWPYHDRLLWVEFAKLKEAAGTTFSGAFHRFRFGYANANVDRLDADLLQHQMRHKDAKTTRLYINKAERLKRSGVADRIHVPDFLKKGSG